MKVNKLTLSCVARPRVYHVGTLNATDKGVRGGSYEGKGLSVSTEPDAWVEIAQLGGLPTHTLKKKGSRFLDYYALVKGNKQALYAWGRQHGHLQLQTVWRVRWEDDEFETVVQSYTDDKAEAKAERADGRDVKRINNFPVPTDAAMIQTGIILADRLSSTHSVLALLLAEEQGLDGVWWEDDLDVDRLSAPRGVILPGKVATWKKS